LSIFDSRLHALPSIFNRKSPVEIAENISREYFSNCSASLGRDTVDPHRREKSLRLVKARREAIFYSGLRVLTQFPTQL
jgi:hypothetical protein